MEWHLWAVEDAQELGLVGVQACEQTVEGEEASVGGEDLIEAPAELASSSPGRALSVGLEVGVEPPDPSSDALLGLALSIAEGIELVDQALGMDPAKRMAGELELTGVIGKDDAVPRQPVMNDGPPEGAFMGDPGWTLRPVRPKARG